MKGHFEGKNNVAGPRARPRSDISAYTACCASYCACPHLLRYYYGSNDSWRSGSHSWRSTHLGSNDLNNYGRTTTAGVQYLRIATASTTTTGTTSQGN